jgi:uncharacterized protein (DUF697 family)
MKLSVRVAVHGSSAAAAGIAALMSPFPFADELALLPLYGLLAVHIGRSHELRFADIPWKPIAKTAVGGLVVRAAASALGTWVPGVAAVVNAVTAATLTEVVGRSIDSACAAVRTAQDAPWPQDPVAQPEPAPARA